MVTLTKVGGQVATNTAEFYGLEKDEKPIEGVPNASSFYAMDSKTISLFDAENKIWLPQ